MLNDQSRVVSQAPRSIPTVAIVVSFILGRGLPPIPPPAITMAASEADLREGEALHNAYCWRCHFPEANGVKSGAVLDLRRSTAATHAVYDAIVRGGARAALGMPSFKDDLSAEQVRLIQAYVLKLTAEAAAAQPAARR